MRTFFIAVTVTFAVAPAFAQKLSVRIIDRRNNDTDYTYVAPAVTNVTSNADARCAGGSVSVNCSASSNTTQVRTPAQHVSYRVRGATFSLQLSDGRVAVVNCQSKSSDPVQEFLNAFDDKSDPVARRSCRMPLVDDIQAEFSGDRAKLRWPVSIDGRKTESETYKILAVLPR